MTGLTFNLYISCADHMLSMAGVCVCQLAVCPVCFMLVLHVASELISKLLSFLPPLSFLSLNPPSLPPPSLLPPHMTRSVKMG